MYSTYHRDASFCQLSLVPPGGRQGQLRSPLRRPPLTLEADPYMNLYVNI